MSGIAIYMEGGGSSADTKGALRRGMDAFLVELKEAARKKSWKWKLVCCGGRDTAFRAYRNAQNSTDYSLVVLLVDAEGPITRQLHEHLNERDQWNLTKLEENNIHLMVQTMETWIVADIRALVAYYGKNFVPNALPNSDNLEEVAKDDIANSLRRATASTGKGEYQKIRHASSLLKQIDPQVVRTRCSYCERLFELLGQEIS